MPHYRLVLLHVLAGLATAVGVHCPMLRFLGLNANRAGDEGVQALALAISPDSAILRVPLAACSEMPARTRRKS